MLGSVVLDVAIGMAFVYLLLSLIASVVQEILATFMQLRSANLERALRSLFSGESLPVATPFALPRADGDPLQAPAAAGVRSVSLVEGLYDHGLVRGLYRDPDTDLASEEDDIWRMPGAVLRTMGNQLRFFLRWTIGIRPGRQMGFLKDPLLLPAYIPSETFALAMIDLLNPGKATGAATVPAIVHLLTKEKGKGAQALRTLAIAAEGDLVKFQNSLETWYNSAMDRASGWYKHYVQTILLGIGMVLAILFNVDSIRVARTLWTDRDVRQAMVQTASDYEAKNSKAQSPTTTAIDVAALRDELNSTSRAFNDAATKTLLPVGWQVPLSEHFKHLCSRDWVGKIGSKLADFSNWQLFFGWCVTAMALSLGAPFWFDTLNRFMVVRGTVKPAEKSQTEGAKS